MKIAMFTDSFTQMNGVSIYIHNMVPALIRKGAEVTVYTGRGKAKGYKVVNLRHIAFPFDRSYDIVLARHVKTDADVVHAHTPYCAGKAGLRTRKPTVSTTHTSPSHMFSMYHLDFLEFFGWKYIISFHNKTDHVVSQTRNTAKEFQQHGLKKPVSIVASGIDFNRFKKANAKHFKNKYDLPDKFILSTSRFSPEKRPEFVLKATQELDIPVVLTSVGPTKSKLEKEHPTARFLGRIHDNEMPDAYAAATVFALTSSDETEGMAMVEAMAAGTPVICSNLPCITERITDGVNGLTFKDYKMFKQKVNRLWNNNGMRKKLGAAGAKTATEFDIDKCAGKLMKVYERVLSES